MRALVQRVSRARVTVGAEEVGAIGKGALVFLGVAKGDTEANAGYLAGKIANLRIFEDDSGKLNLSLKDIGGGLLVVSQFTLISDTRHGRRPSFTGAAEPALAESLYESFILHAEKELKEVRRGRFRAMMEVELVNDGPVTLLLEDPQPGA
ncbi:MAG: D-tyrosyl-tRNA(Tyr) deacylase [Deltaproteobacteria bacterium]|jgi:D-tyrosyl-tRNA(Tyr) deacylase|nr:D-tyrosyl-tRNA(Tyr) deacylase [Deltaproteobacteria bacterium]